MYLCKAGDNEILVSHRDAFLGFWVSATTHIKGTCKINTFSMDACISRLNEGSLPTSMTLDFTKRQRAVCFLFWSPYALKTDPEKFKRIVGAPLERMYGLEIAIAEVPGFLTRKDKTYELTDKSAAIHHHMEQMYTAAYIGKMWNVSGKQAFPERIVQK